MINQLKGRDKGKILVVLNNSDFRLVATALNIMIGVLFLFQPECLGSKESNPSFVQEIMKMVICANPGFVNSQKGDREKFIFQVVRSVLLTSTTKSSKSRSPYYYKQQFTEKLSKKVGAAVEEVMDDFYRVSKDVSFDIMYYLIYFMYYVTNNMYYRIVSLNTLSIWNVFMKTKTLVTNRDHNLFLHFSLRICITIAFHHRHRLRRRSTLLVDYRVCITKLFGIH